MQSESKILRGSAHLYIGTYCSFLDTLLILPTIQGGGILSLLPGLLKPTLRHRNLTYKNLKCDKPLQIVDLLNEDAC